MSSQVHPPVGWEATQEVDEITAWDMPSIPTADIAGRGAAWDIPSIPTKEADVDQEKLVVPSVMRTVSEETLRGASKRSVPRLKRQISRLPDSAWSVPEKRGDGSPQGDDRTSSKDSYITQLEGVLEDGFNRRENTRPAAGRQTVGSQLDFVLKEQQRLQVGIILDYDDCGSEYSDSSHGPVIPVKKVTKLNFMFAALIAMTCLAALCVVWFWDPRTPSHLIHHAKMNKYQSHIKSPLYAISSSHGTVIFMKDEFPTLVLDVKMAVPCIDSCAGVHRRLSASASLGHSVSWELMADQRILKSGVIVLSAKDEAEAYEILSPDDLGAVAGEKLSVRLKTTAKYP
jgi:hypothetical protein